MKRMIGIAAMLVLAISLYGCGGSTSLVDPTVDLTGTWEIGEVITSSNCPTGLGDTSTWGAIVVQNGNSLTVTVDDPGAEADGSTFTGTVSGDQVDWEGDVPTDGGTSTITSTNITATDDTLSGTANWNWTDGDISCNGTTTLEGYKL